jgi:curved DNA-binding protein CbpA
MSQSSADAGSFRAGEFAGLLRALQEERTDGRLQVRSGELSCSLFLTAGSVAAIAADAERYRLGEWLVARGTIAAEPMALALLRQPPDTPFGQQLVDEGVISATTLHEELQLRATAMVGLLLFSPGEYALQRGDLTPSAALTIDLSTTALLLAASRSCERERLEELVADSSDYLKARESALDQVRDAMLRPEEAYLLSRLDRATRTEDLCRLVPMPQDELRRVLASLMIAGLAELRGEPDVANAARSMTAKPLPSAEAGPPAAARAGATTTGAPAGYTADQERERMEVRRLSIELPNRDFYRRLGVSRGATLTQIHVSYNDLSRLYDPSRSAEPHLTALRPELEKIHASLTEAYRTLGNPHQRAGYDDFLKAHPGAAEKEYASPGNEVGARRALLDANRRRAHELVRLGKVGEAVQLFDQIVRLDPVADELVQLAQLELRNPMWAQRALNHLKAALSLDAQQTSAWLELARFWERRKRVDKQRECLRKILDYDPENKDVQASLVSLPVV